MSIALAVAVLAPGDGAADNLTSRGTTAPASDYFAVGGGLMIALPGADPLYPHATTDADGRPLDGAHTCVLHIDTGNPHRRWTASDPSR